MHRTSNSRSAGSNPARDAKQDKIDLFPCGAVVAQRTVNPLVVGSNPTGGAKQDIWYE